MTISVMPSTLPRLISQHFNPFIIVPENTGNYDEDGSYVPPLPDSGESIDEHGKEHGSEEVEESPEVSQFREVHEVRFQGEVGPLGGHRLCKIKCEHGRWIGPLCAINEQGKLFNLTQ